MTRKYHSLLERTPEDGALWSIQFGDYDKEVVRQEMHDMKDSGSFEKGTKLIIITTGAAQSDINAKVHALNELLLRSARGQ